jgi:methylation protein EvaC
MMPIANAFLDAADFEREPFFDLEVGLCNGCSLVQLTRVIEPDKLYHENYAYFSSISARMAEHFRDFAQQASRRLANVGDPFVLEIGSNDGIMLRHFAGNRVRHLGVEPSRNVAQAAIERGVNTMCGFFDERSAAEIRQQHGPANIVLGANVISHIVDFDSVISGVDLLLEDDGVFIFEEPYLGDIVKKTSYDQFYDEHVYYFCISSLNNLLDRHGMLVVDAEPQNVHGGSMRYTVARQTTKQMAPRLAGLKTGELALGLGQMSTFQGLKGRIDQSRDQLKSLLGDLRREGKRVVGYGATSKSTTVTNYGGIGPDLIEFISDTTPTKQGKFSPGTHIPIKPYEEFAANYPDYAVLFAWNHGEEIIANEQGFLNAGGRFIAFVPEVGIVD